MLLKVPEPNVDQANVPLEAVPFNVTVELAQIVAVANPASEDGETTNTVM